MEKIYGLHTVLALLKTMPSLVIRLYLQAERNDQRLLEIKTLAENFGVEVIFESRALLDQQLSEDQRHQGVVAEVKRFPEYGERDLDQFLKLPDVLLLILDGVQDPHNLGACLRSANAFGVHAVIIPKDKSVGLTSTVRKVACGAAEVTPVVSVTNLARTLKHIQQEGVWLVGACGESNSELSDLDLTGRIGLVMGAEGKGLRRLTREHCDYLAKIPMFGTVSSLNVSVATGIGLYEVIQQRKGNLNKTIK